MTEKQTTGIKKNKMFLGDNGRKRAIIDLGDWKAIDYLQNTAMKLQKTKKEKA